MLDQERPKIKEFAALLNSLNAPARKDALELLKDGTEFCWDCGYGYRYGRTCHCQNDE